MPIYIRTARVDWAWRERSQAERALVRRHQALLDEGDHGWESFVAQLTDASAELPSVAIAALVELDTRSRTLFLARAGKVTPVAIKDAVGPLGAMPWSELPELPVDDLPTIQCGDAADEVDAALAQACTDDERAEPEDGELELPLAYTSEEAMRDALTQAARAMSGEAVELVAEVANTRYRVSLQPGRLQIEPTRPWPSSDRADHAQLIERLLAASPDELVPAVTAARERVAASGGDKLAQPLYFPAPVLQDIVDTARRVDRSLSWVVQSAWAFARAPIAELADRAAASARLTPLPEAPQRKQTLYFPGPMLIEIEDAAGRFDSSASWVVRLAWTLAQAHLAALPAPEPEPDDEEAEDES